MSDQKIRIEIGIFSQDVALCIDGHAPDISVINASLTEALDQGWAIFIQEEGGDLNFLRPNSVDWMFVHAIKDDEIEDGDDFSRKLHVSAGF